MKVLKQGWILLFLLIFSVSGLFIYAEDIPQPKDILGFEVGADYHLATYTQAVVCFKKLEESSDKIRLYEAGITSMGQVMTYAVISSPENLAELDKYKSIVKRLSLVRGLSDESAKDLALDGRAIVYIDGGLHASECAPAQHNIKLAYNLVSDEDARTKKILKEVILVPANSVNISIVEKIAKDLDLVINGISGRPKENLREIKQPRVGLYKSWTANADEGWTRFVLKNFEFPFSNIHDAEIQADNLKENFDVIIFSHTSRPESIINGNAKGTVPPKYVGGITFNGVRNLRTFAKEGGTLIFLNGSCDMAISSFDLPVRNLLKSIKKEDFICDGSLLRNEFDTTHPIAYGMPKTNAIVFENSCAFDILSVFGEKAEPKSIAKFPGENPLMSGWLHGEKKIRHKNTIVEVPYGNGVMVLLGFPVQYRAQPCGTFKLFFNAVMYRTGKT